MFKGVKLGDKHSNDYNLVLTNKEIPLPDLKTNIINIPGANGSLDLSEVLTRNILYKNRTLVLKFEYLGTWNTFQSMISKIADDLHGKKIKVIFDIDSNYYYEGRAKIDKLDSDIKKKSLTIKVDAYPFKIENKSSIEDWLWDEFSFEDGIIREYTNLVVNKKLILNIPGRKMSAVPIIISNKNMKVTYNNITYSIEAGENIITELATSEGDNIYTFTGNGTINIDYRGGRL